jgi:RNA polymerase sigma-54 factor
MAQAIGELEPRPGRDYVDSRSRATSSRTCTCSKVGDKYYVVSANDDGMPRLKISGFYRAAMAGDPQAKEYIQNKLRSAQWLIRSIDQRSKTIVRVTECIVEKQKDFFDKGIEYLKPMILRDVAETVGMHESTISRVTSRTSTSHTPRGMFELKYFFNSPIRRESTRTDIASESVKQAIKKIIAVEDTANPLQRSEDRRDPRDRTESRSRDGRWPSTGRCSASCRRRSARSISEPFPIVPPGRARAARGSRHRARGRPPEHVRR